MPSIRLSEKHGVNPSLSVCFYCNGEKNELVLPGRLPGDAEAPRKAVWNMEPCYECAEWMRKGIILISVRPGSDPKNPYRTGGWTVIKAEAFARIVGPSHPALTSRFCFIEDEAWDRLGLTRSA